MIINRPSIKNAITKLYENAEIPQQQSEKICIIPLRMLIGAFNLECIELPNLSAKSAIEFLAKYDPTIKSDESEDTLLAGYLYVTSNFGCIFLNQTDRITRRRFSAAHELGHYLLHFRPILDALKRKGEIISFHHADQTVADDDNEEEIIQEKSNSYKHSTELSDYKEYLPSFNQMENEADNFASELLIPNNMLAPRLASLNLLDDLLARHLATEFLVSRSAMERRLKEFELA